MAYKYAISKNRDLRRKMRASGITYRQVVDGGDTYG